MAWPLAVAPVYLSPFRPSGAAHVQAHFGRNCARAVHGVGTFLPPSLGSRGPLHRGGPICSRDRRGLISAIRPRADGVHISSLNHNRVTRSMSSQTVSQRADHLLFLLSRFVFLRSVALEQFIKSLSVTNLQLIAYTLPFHHPAEALTQ